MSRIDWRHDGRRILLPIALLPPAADGLLAWVEARALIDTGATASGITAPMIEHLKLQGHGKRPLKSAHGDGQAERYVFRVGFFPNHDPMDETPRLPFIFDDVFGFGLKDYQHFDALIGMDILSQCDFSMTRGRRCTLSFGSR